MFRWTCTLFLAFGLTAFAAEKHPVPGDTDSDAVRTRIRALFKVEYTKTSPTGILTLVDKLMSGAAEEKSNPATRYVMLTEAVTLAMRGGDVDKAVRAAREIDRDFEATRFDAWLADVFAEAIGAKEQIDEYRVIAKLELGDPKEGKDRFALAQRWMELAKEVKTDFRWFPYQRARFWLRESLNAQQLKGLERTEAEKKFSVLNTEIERIDAKFNRFSLYQGKWAVKYTSGSKREYSITLDGTLTLERAFGADGQPNLKKEEQYGKLIRRNGVVLVPLVDGTIIERFSLDRDKLIIDRFSPASTYPKGPPQNKGEGVREK